MKRGLTLVEIMVGVILSSIVLGAGFQIWSSARRDITTANLRQNLQHDIRIALDRMGSDFKSMKAGTLTDPVQNGNSYSFTLDRYVADKDGKPTTKTVKVTWEFNEVSHVLSRTESGGDYDGKRIMSTNLISLDVSRGSESTLQVKGSAMASVANDSESGRSARFDITMDGERKNTMTGKIEKHTEKTTVFVRDEYYTAITKGKHLKIRELTATESSELTASKIDAKEGFFAKNLTDEMLAGMSKTELQDLKTKETEARQQAEDNLKKLNDSLGQIDAKKSFLWFVSKSTETSKIQDRIIEHDTKAELEQDIKELDEKINKDEKTFIQNSLNGAGLNYADIEKDPTKAKAYKEAYELQIRKRNLEKSIKEMGDKAENAQQKQELQKMVDDMNTQIQSGQIQRAQNEDQKSFEARQAHMAQVLGAAKQMDMTWMDGKEEELKEYEAAKQIIDLGQAKLGSVDGRDSAQANITKLDEFINKAKS